MLDLCSVLEHMLGLLAITSNQIGAAVRILLVKQDPSVRSSLLLQIQILLLV